MQLSEIKKVHFIGIGGIGMSGLSRLFVNEGKDVSGSDAVASSITSGLETIGITFFDTQTKENIVDNIDLVIYTEAMEEAHEEMQAARALGVPMMNYFEALGVIANQYYLIAVAGSHGKTTTTAMLIDVIEDAGFDPTAIVGSLRSRTGSNFRAGKSKYMIVEACEFHRDFLSLTADILVITNIEAEHLDYYKDLADVQDAFTTLVSQVREDGYVVANVSDPNVGPVLQGASATVVDYTKFVDPLLQLIQPGMHNMMNAAGALAVADILDIKEKPAKESLEHFNGTWRRFEYKGAIETGAIIYDDYGHHPTEIRATIDGAKTKHPGKNIVVVYQPHLHSRTKELYDDFVSALGFADSVALVPIYEARKESDRSVSSKDLAKDVQGVYCKHFDAAATYLKEHTSESDVILVMGAGDVTKVTELLI